MKKDWDKPRLDVLDVKMTEAGVGLTVPDAKYDDPDEHATFHHDS